MSKYGFSDILCKTVLILFGVCLLISPSIAAPAEYTLKARILVLNSYHKGFPWTDNIVSGIEEVLGREEFDADIAIEYMDSKSMEYNQAYKAMLYELYSYKYLHQKFDVIISSDDNAFNFLREFHEEIFPDTPVVFCGVNNSEAPKLINRDYFTGIIELSGVEKTLDLALKQHPETKQVVIIADTTPTGKARWRQVEPLFIQHPEITFTRIDDSFSISEIEDRMKKLSDDTIAIFATLYRDKTGRYISLAEGASRVSKSSRRPIYTTHTQVLQHGTIGGKLLGGQQHGEESAEMVVRILKGEKVSNISIIDQSVAKYIFDYQQLERFGIKQSDLPKESIVKNIPFSFYNEFKGLVWSTVSVVLVLTIIIIMLNLNIAKRKQVEEALRESEDTFKHIFESANVGKSIVLPTGEITANQAFAKMLGYNKEELNNVTWHELTPTDEIERNQKLLSPLLDGINDSARYTKRYSHKNGSHVWADVNIVMRRNPDGEPLHFFTTIVDITERISAEQRIEHLNRVLRSIRDINQLIVRKRDPAALIREGCRLLVDNRGYTSALIVLTDDNDQPHSWAGWGIAASSKSLETMLERHELPPCFEWARSAKVTRFIDNRAGVCERCPIADICREAPSLCVRLVHEDSAFGYIVVALEHNLRVDDEELGLFSEMAGDLAYALNFLRIEVAHESSKRKRKTLENKLAQAQKMESVGRLAGGVAHDYNNISTTIIGFTELALGKVDPSDPLHEDLMEIMLAAKHSTEITRQLLAFARQQTIAPKVLNLSDTIGSMLKMLRRLIGEDIDLVCLPGTDECPVKIDPSQVDQILVNLCVNSRDAIADVGKVTIETKNIDIDENYCADKAGFVPGEYVMLAVSDDGCGMSPESQRKIFEPYFTTKAQGKGTGLGLSTVYGIIKQNNGFINVYSEPGKGTSVKIYLPRHRGKAMVAHADKNRVIPLSSGDEVVLLVEDDTSIMKLGKIILKDLGYDVLSATRPHRALRLAENYDGEIHLLITDVVMPEMNGRELSEKLEALYPNLKILFMSGYTANVIAHRGVLEDGVNFISKPFSMKDIAVKVREVLDKAKDIALA